MTREEAIDCINAIHVQMFNSGNSKWTEACDMAIADMKEMDRLAKSEPVLKEPDRPHGEWIDKGEYAECSLCGSCSGTQFDGLEPIPLKTNFCPNCGAKMKEGDRNEVD